MSWFSKLVRGLSASHQSEKKTYETVTTPQVPDWLQTTAVDLNGRISTLGARDPASFVAPVHALERQAETSLAGLTGQGQVYEEAMAETRKVAGNDWMGAYMSAATPKVTRPHAWSARRSPGSKATS